MQVQQEWLQLIGLERRARVTSQGVGFLMAEERAGIGAVQTRAM